MNTSELMQVLQSVVDKIESKDKQKKRKNWNYNLIRIFTVTILSLLVCVILSTSKSMINTEIKLAITFLVYIVSSMSINLSGDTYYEKIGKMRDLYELKNVLSGSEEKFKEYYNTKLNNLYDPTNHILKRFFISSILSLVVTILISLVITMNIIILTIGLIIVNLIVYEISFNCLREEKDLSFINNLILNTQKVRIIDKLLN